MRRIGVLTSGGDSPGMNACIRAVVRSALYNGIEVYGIERGFNGLINNVFVKMQSHSVSNIIQRGGTILKTARSEEFRTKEGRDKAFKNMQNAGIDGLVAIGGDGTYTGIKILSEENENLRVIGLPGTIDNDLFGTDYTIGYDTAINTAVVAIDKIRDTADSHDRIFFIEVMGRDTGFIAMDVGIGAGAEAILIPETKTYFNKLVETLRRGWGRKKGSQIIVVAEGDDFGGAEETVAAVKKHIPDLDYRVMVLGHIQRGGSPTVRDRVLASRLGAGAVEALLAGQDRVALGVMNNKLHSVSLEDAITKEKNIPLKIIELAEILGS